MNKQETLEEAVKAYYEENIDQSNIPREHYELEIQNLMSGFAYKWQQERSYSDMQEYAEYCTNHVLTSQIGHPYLSPREWFEQFKNKQS